MAINSPLLASAPPLIFVSFTANLDFFLLQMIRNTMNIYVEVSMEKCTSYCAYCGGWGMGQGCCRCCRLLMLLLKKMLLFCPKFL